jgi:hypothetical protein
MGGRSRVRQIFEVVTDYFGSGRYFRKRYFREQSRAFGFQRQTFNPHQHKNKKKIINGEYGNDHTFRRWKECDGNCSPQPQPSAENSRTNTQTQTCSGSRTSGGSRTIGVAALIIPIVPLSAEAVRIVAGDDRERKKRRTE